MIKKVISISICVCMLILMQSVAVFAEEPTLEQRLEEHCKYLGIIDDKGKVRDVKVSDARKALRIAVDLETASEQEKRNADINADGEVSVSEARSILRYALDLSGFDIPESVASKEEVVKFFVCAANKVKEEKPGLDRKTTGVNSSIKLSISNSSDIQDMELYETKEDIDKLIKDIEDLRAEFGDEIVELILKETMKEFGLDDEEIMELDLDGLIAELNRGKDDIDKEYEPKVETFHVNAGNSHQAAFTVKGKAWSSKAQAEDILSAKFIYFKDTYRIAITYDDFHYTKPELPSDMTTLEYGKMFDVPSYNALVKPSNTDFTFNGLTLKNGSVNCNVDLKTCRLEKVEYFYEYIWDYIVTTKDTMTNEDVENRYVYTVENTAEYEIGSVQAD